MCFGRLERDDKTVRRTTAKKGGVITDIAPDIKNPPIATDIADTPPFCLHLTIGIVASHMRVIGSETNWLRLGNHRPDRSQIELDSRGRSFNIQTAPLVDRSNIGAADGVLGLDSLQNQRVLIDFAEQRIAVADARDLGGNRGYEIVVTARRRLGQLIITSARFDNVRVAVIVDTGAEASIGNDALMRRLRGGNAGPAQITDINGVQASGTVRMASEVRIGDAKLSNIPVAFVESPLFKQLGLEGQPAMVLGMNELRLFRRVAIDFKQGKILFDLPPQATLPQDVFRVMPF